MQLENNTVHVWTTSLAISEADATTMMAILSNEENAQASRFKFSHHRLRYIASHYFLRILIAKYTQIEPKAIQYAFNAHQKPHLAMPVSTDLQFNMSHSDAQAIYAFGRVHPLGVDIEQVHDKRNIEIADRFFSNEEQAALANLSGEKKIEAFYRVWTQKEALIKATGRGLAEPLQSFSVPLSDNPALVKIGNDAWRLHRLSVTTGFTAALACHPSINTILPFQVDAEPMGK